MNNNKCILNCEITSDLLPLYHDGTVNDTTKEAVKEHLFSCEKCQQEYNQLSKEFPQITISTKDQFSKAMSKKRKKQIITTCFLCFMTFVLVVAGYFALTELRLKPLSDTEIQCVYRYSNGEDNKIFLSYFTHTRSGSTPKATVKEENGKTVYIFERMVPIISEYDENECYHEIECFEIPADCDALYFGGKEVWSEEKNSDDTVPPYVYAYEEFENGNDDEFSQGISFGYSDGLFSIYYGDEKKETSWDINGNVVSDITYTSDGKAVKSQQ